mmetsp:Transcript_5643/g.23162  ORF Transcript_5643/g.23162 Transcript_5643/m.23162 type:complete len:439 (-) Transcript_5643:37-1353(-)
MFAVAPILGAGAVGLGRARTLPTSTRISTSPRSTNRVATVVRAARKGSPQSAQGRKKMSKGKIAKKNQEFIEQDNEKDAQIDAMRKAAAASRASVDEGEQASSMPPGKLDGMSFEDKLKAVKEEGAAKRQQMAEAEAPRKLMDEMLTGKAPVMRSSIYDEKPGGITFAQAGGDAPDDELNVFVKIGAGLLSLGLLVVFIPSDFVFSTNVSSAPNASGELSPEVVEQVKKQVTIYEEALASTPEDVDKLRGAAESYVVLEDYTAAIPLLKRLLEIQPSVENVGNLADVYAANGSLAKAAETYRDAVNAEWSGSTPPPALVKGLVDALDKDGRYGLSLEYVKKFRDDGRVDDVDGALLEARVYSGWKGHSKDAEKAYQDVIDTHGDDFRGYLAKGVFYREIGKADAAEGMFRQAKALVPGEMREVVNTVIAQAKAQGALQ